MWVIFLTISRFSSSEIVSVNIIRRNHKIQIYIKSADSIDLKSTYVGQKQQLQRFK